MDNRLTTNSISPYAKYMGYVGLLLFATQIWAGGPNCTHDAKTFRCVKYIKNYDGDTVTVKIPDVHPLLGENISVRVLGIDTPEKNGHKPCEKARARDAQRLVENLMKHASTIELRHIGRDKYFRILAEVWADGKSIGDLLIKNHLAYPYDGGRKPANTNWCGK